MSTQTPVQSKPDIKQDTPPVDPQELIKRIIFKPTAFIWNNFAQKQPDIDRWVILWCNLGNLANNLFLTFRDAAGNYDMPHPTKQYPVRAWAYINLPEVDKEHMEKAKKELVEEAKKPKVVEEKKHTKSRYD